MIVELLFDYRWLRPDLKRLLFRFFSLKIFIGQVVGDNFVPNINAITSKFSN